MGVKPPRHLDAIAGLMHGAHTEYISGQRAEFHSAGATIEFPHIASRLFSGFESRDGFNLALPEKALLDTLYLRKTISFRDELELDQLDNNRLAEMAAPFLQPPAVQLKALTG